MAEILLDVQHLTHYFKLGKNAVIKAVDDLSFQVRRGEIFGLVGESGSGKSTAARCVMNIYRPSAGKIIYKGVDTCDSRAFHEHKKMLQTEAMKNSGDSQKENAITEEIRNFAKENPEITASIIRTMLREEGN